MYSDCYSFVVSWVEAQANISIDSVRISEYDSVKSAIRAIRKAGFQDLFEVFDHFMERTEQPCLGDVTMSHEKIEPCGGCGVYLDEKRKYAMTTEGMLVLKIEPNSVYWRLPG